MNTHAHTHLHTRTHAHRHTQRYTVFFFSFGFGSFTSQLFPQLPHYFVEIISLYRRNWAFLGGLWGRSVGGETSEWRHNCGGSLEGETNQIAQSKLRREWCFLPWIWYISHTLSTPGLAQCQTMSIKYMGRSWDFAPTSRRVINVGIIH